MRLIVIGNAGERRRLRDALEHSAPEVVGEFTSLVEARAAGIGADGVVMSGPRDAGPEDALASADNGSTDVFAETLTTREREVLQSLADGLSNKAIAQRLGISDQTVKFHVSSIYGKLGAANRADAVRRAARRGLLTL